MPDAEAEVASVEPDSLSFVEALVAREKGEAGVQNGFGPGDKDSLEGDDKAGISASPERTCPVELHKAALMYPSIALSLRSS